MVANVGDHEAEDQPVRDPECEHAPANRRRRVPWEVVQRRLCELLRWRYPQRHNGKRVNDHEDGRRNHTDERRDARSFPRLGTPVPVGEEAEIEQPAANADAEEGINRVAVQADEDLIRGSRLLLGAGGEDEQHRQRPVQDQGADGRFIVHTLRRETKESAEWDIGHCPAAGEMGAEGEDAFFGDLLLHYMLSAFRTAFFTKIAWD